VNGFLLPLNPAKFDKMVRGDCAELADLACEYFCETRQRMVGWSRLIDAGDFTRLREELHRCKGVACMLGLDRLAALLDECESSSQLETDGINMKTMRAELLAAEQAVGARSYKCHRCQPV
jgi:hypothetical protein